jgi:geranylgeranylglycerol-phosphate geranylgeranyltransferase
MGAFVGITSSGGIFNYSILLAFLSLAFLVAAFNTLNCVIDVNVDKINKPHRPIPSGKISGKNALIYSLILYAISLAIAYQLTIEFFLIILASTILTIFYSMPKVRFKKRFLVNNLTGGIFYGLLCPLAGWALTPVNPIPIYLIIFVFLLSLSLSLTKDFEDVIGDKAYAIKTIPTIFGIRNAARLFSILIVLAFVYIMFLVGFNLVKPEFIFSILMLPAFLYLIKKVYEKPKDFYNSLDERSTARRIFFMLVGLGILLELLIGIIAIF